MAKSFKSPNTQYFASLSLDELIPELEMRASSWGDAYMSNNYLDKLRKSWSYYYGYFNQGKNHQVGFTGEQSELVQMPVNHYRNIGLHILNMITATRPSLNARATNTDYKSRAQTILANGLLDYYMREKQLEDYLKRAAESAVVFGEGYVRIGWNATAGEVFEKDEENGETFYEGDVEFNNLSPFDVIRDPSKEDNNHDWLIIRTYKNRFALMAKYPEMAEAIGNAPSKDDLDHLKWPMYGNVKTDDIPVYEFFHKKNDALPEGKYTIYVSTDAVLYDGALPYREIPIYRLSASDILGTPFGYTILFDLMPVQEAINMLNSVILTNQNAFGVQNILVPKGGDIILSQLSGGLNIIEYNQLGAAPSALNLTQTPKEIFDMLKQMEQTIETLSGINSVTRGQPEASLRSAASLALVQAQAVQFSSSLQQSFARLNENVGTALIHILQDYAKYPRVAAVAGKSQRTYLKSFSSKDLVNINRVIVEITNPLSKTTAGRLEIANQLIQMQLVKNVDEYFTVLNTGKLDTMFEGKQAESMLVSSENEEMMDGNPVIALAIDMHQIHIDEHKVLLADPEMRKNPKLVGNVLNHIQEHLNLLRTTDPGLLAVTGQQPLPPIAPPQAPQGGPQGAPEGPNGGSEAAAQLTQTPPTGAEEAQQTANTQMPVPSPPFEGMPTNPANVPVG